MSGDALPNESRRPSMMTGPAASVSLVVRQLRAP